MRLLTNILAFKPIALFFAALFSAVVMGGCADSDPTSSREPGSLVCDDAFRLELNIGFDGVASRISRADSESDTTRGTDFENTIKTITIFVFDESDKLKTYATLDSSEYAQLPFTANDENSCLTISKVFTNIIYGNYTIYVAANLSSAQIQSFAAEIQLSGTCYTFPSSRLDLASDITSQTFGMAMSCAEPKKIEFSATEKDAVCSFNMKRIAAKTLVIAKTDNSKKYAIVDAKDKNGKQKFMVLLDNLTFTVNSVNTRTYLFQRSADTKPYVLDPNVQLAGGSETQFVYNPISSWINFGSYFKKVRPHDPANYPYDNIYAQNVIYFPENTFVIPTDLSGLQPEKQATHVVVRAKIVPLSLMVPKGLKQFAYDLGVDSDLYDIISVAEDACPVDKNVYVVHCSTAEFSNLICELALRYENFLGGVSTSTFFVNTKDTDRNLYTYSAAKMVAQGSDYSKTENNTLNLTDFEVYNDGYANYTVFFSEPRALLVDSSAEKWMWSQVFRNTYYILCIDKFLSPGQGLDPDEKFIQVHTKVVNYVNSWNGQIDIDDETPTTSNP